MTSKQVEDASKSTRSEAQARAVKRRLEVTRWMGAQHASGYFAILSYQGLEVARFTNAADRDTVLALVKLTPQAGKAITALAFEQEAYINAKKTDTVGFAQVSGAKDGLIKALDDVANQ